MSDLSGSADCPELGRPYLRAEDFELDTEGAMDVSNHLLSKGLPRALAKWLTRKRERSNDVAGGGADVVRPCVGSNRSLKQRTSLL